MQFAGAENFINVLFWCVFLQVFRVKELLASKQKATLGEVDPKAMKLIYSGRILADEKTIEECQIAEKDFLVLLVTKVGSIIDVR
jgi:uncharacterized ubiquitin-like protein YukD